ncbi:hypothetical protein ABTZ99_37020 [Actinosynnema sp. NPDC002837]
MVRRPLAPSDRRERPGGPARGTAGDAAVHERGRALTPASAAAGRASVR